MSETNEWDSYADGWDQDEVVRTYAEKAYSSLRALLNAWGVSLEGARVLDFGCGTGLLTERLVGDNSSVHAVDTSTAMLDVVRSKAERFGWVDVVTTTQLPDGGGTFDLIVCSSVCSFLSDYTGTVEQLSDLLSPGGHFVQWDWERDDNDPEPHGLSRAEIREVLGSAGLDNVVVETAFTAMVGGQTMAPLMGCGQRAR